MEKRRTFYVASEIFEQPHTANAVAVYAYLSCCADRQGMSFPSIETIGKHCGISRNTTRKALKELCESGLLRIESASNVLKSGGARRTSNRYHIAPAKKTADQKPSFSCAESDPRAGQNLTGEGSESDRVIDDKNSKSIMDDVPSVGYNRVREETDRTETDRILEKLHLDIFYDQAFAQSVRQTILRMYRASHWMFDGQRVSQDAVRERLQMLTIDHIDHVERQLETYGGEVSKGERYLAACIYHAPIDCMVNWKHDSA